MSSLTACARDPQVSQQLRQRSVAADALDVWCHSMILSGAAASALEVVRSSPVAVGCDAVWWRLCDALIDRGATDAALDCAARVDDAALDVVPWRRICDRRLTGGEQAPLSRLIHLATSAEPSLVSGYVEHICLSLLTLPATDVVMDGDDEMEALMLEVLQYDLPDVVDLALTWCTPAGRCTVLRETCARLVASGQLHAAADTLRKVHELGGVPGWDVCGVAVALCHALLGTHRAGPAVAAAAVTRLVPEEQRSRVLDMMCGRIGKTLMHWEDFREALRLRSSIGDHVQGDALLSLLAVKALGAQAPPDGDIRVAMDAVCGLVNVRQRMCALRRIVRRLISLDEVDMAEEVARVTLEHGPVGTDARADSQGRVACDEVWRMLAMALVREGDAKQASLLAVHITCTKIRQVVCEAISRM